MWVKMLVDQIKGWGIYLKGQTMDLPESIVEKFDEGSYEITVAPWDTNVPHEKLRLRNAQNRLRDAKDKLTSIESALNAAETHIDELKKNQKTASAEIEAAEKELAEAQEAAQKLVEEEVSKKTAEEEAARKAAEEEAARKAAEEEAARKAAEEEAARKAAEESGNGSEKETDKKPKRQPPKRR